MVARNGPAKRVRNPEVVTEIPEDRSIGEDAPKWSENGSSMDGIRKPPLAEKKKRAPNHDRSLYPTTGRMKQHMADAPLRGRGPGTAFMLKSLSAQGGGLREADTDARARLNDVNEAAFTRPRDQTNSLQMKNTNWIDTMCLVHKSIPVSSTSPMIFFAVLNSQNLRSHDGILKTTNQQIGTKITVSFFR